jgi:hypothetical protein
MVKIKTRAPHAAQILLKIFLRYLSLIFLIHNFQSIGSIPFFIKYSFVFENAGKLKILCQLRTERVQLSIPDAVFRQPKSVSPAQIYPKAEIQYVFRSESLWMT